MLKASDSKCETDNNQRLSVYMTLRTNGPDLGLNYAY